MENILIESKPHKDIAVTCFGEVLWDVFGDDRRVGGAPLNVCLRLSSLGINTQIISAVGNDNLGAELINFVESQGASIELIEQSTDKMTSTVQVTLDKNGSATYDIVKDTAWDNIKQTQAQIDAVYSSDVFVFGSLICRNETSHKTLLSLLEHAKFSIFDVNLRAPHYDMQTLRSLMNKADFIKLNDDELYEIAIAFGSPFNALEQHLEFIAEITDTQYLCVTKGSHGALLKIKDQKFYHSGYQVKVADTVGAGDSFLGSLIYQLITSKDAQHAVNFACAVGALVAQNHGATPTLTLKEIHEFMQII
ncbi:carbohydrate kinase [Shewanella electrodiphila]|uniref:Carbohydrate kinase n=1 Tax=Shewanella electrodiphila TaxID=934143 RepID=A0ABT0KSD3_9GAMM|nr:carbohydrate kinase [Shewanella electrodiphila]MCL1046747.1 carbohydrate kinase [Shewanella electrodiphila]